MSEERKSNIELLRIVAIFSIILGHYYCHTSWNDISKINEVLLRVFGNWSKLGINVFILTTGYFMIEKSGGVRDKVLNLAKDRFFYSLLASLIALCLGATTINVKFILNTIFPLLTFKHHFISCFVLLYFFIPYLNKFIHSLNLEDFEKLLVLGFFVCSFLPTINPTCKVDGYSYISWMLYIYSIGAYIKLSDRKILRCKSSAYFILFAVVAVLSITVTIFANTYITTKIGNYLFDMYMVNILLASVLLFLAFLKLDIGYCKIINIFAAQTFGVYLLHDDPYVRTFLWNNLFRAFELGNSNYLILHMFGCSILVWIIGVMVHFVWGKIKATVKRK